VGFKDDIEALTSRVASARVIARAIVEGQIAKRALMTDKLPNTAGLATAIDKLTEAIESDAKKRLERVEEMHAKRQRVFAKADERLNARDASLDAADAALEQLDAALGDNGGPKLPTSDG